MKEFDKIISEAEKEGIQVNQSLSRLLLDMWRSASDDMRRLTRRARILCAVAIVACVLSAVCISGCVYLGIALHKQQGETDALWGVLSDGVVVEETVTTTEETVTTVQQESDGNNIYQAGEHSSYWEG